MKTIKPLEYTQVKDFLIEAIKSGRIQPNCKLPSERELRETLLVNRNTVRHALNQLECEGYIYRSSRRGWYAKGTRLVYNPAEHVNFTRLVAGQGMEPSWEILETDVITADDSLASKFEVEPGAPLYINSEVGAIDGLKAYYAEIIFNAELCPEILPKIENASITRVLKEEYNILVRQTELLIRPVRLGKNIHTYLGIPNGTPGLYIRRKKKTQNNKIVEVDYEFWRYDAIEIKVNDL